MMIRINVFVMIIINLSLIPHQIYIFIYVFSPIVNQLLALKLIIQMGNQNSLINNEQFVKQDWQPVQKLPDCQIWQNRKEPGFRIEQYEIYSQNEAEMKQERKMYELRRRNPLLVSAYYFESKVTEEFCSSHYKQSLYLERIPIRLMDVEHIPYPDCLHLYEVCLKGFAQLARTAGCFLVDESMIGINQRGRVKAWLNDDFSKSSPFCGKVAEENMVRSVIETVDRNVDSEQMPADIPTVRNFLYKNTDSLNFDVAIWEFGEFVKRFNNGKLPGKLECIDKVGGIYAIANRQRWDHDEVQPHEDKFTGTGFSEVSGAYNKLYQENAQHLASSPQFRQQEIVQPVREIAQPQKPQINFISQPVGTLQMHNQVQNHQLVREMPFIRPQIVVPLQNQPILSPRNTPPIYFEPPKQRPVEIVVQPQPDPHAQFISQPQPAIQIPPQIIQNPLFIPPKSPTFQPRPIIINQEFPRSPIQKPIPPPVIPVSPVANSRPKPFFLSQLKKNQTQKQAFPQSASKGKVPSFIPQTNNAPKFTVQVIPGKVYPQKSSTIFKQNNNNPTTQKKVPTILDQQPIINTEKTVEEAAPQTEESKQSEQPLLKQEVIVQSQQKHEQEYQKPEDSPDVPLQYTQEVTIQHQKMQQKRQTIFQKVSNNFQALENKIVVSKSYQVQQKIPQKVQPPSHEVIAQQNSQTSNAGLRQDRMSTWTAGSHENTIDYQQMEKRLAISFNPAQQAQQFIPFAQQKSELSIQNQPIAEKTVKEDEDTQSTPLIENTIQQQKQKSREGDQIRATGRFNFGNLQVKQSLYEDNPYLADYQPTGIQRQYYHHQNDGKSSPDFLRKLNEFKQTEHFSSYTSYPNTQTYTPLTFANTPTLTYSTYQPKSFTPLSSQPYNPFTSSNDYFIGYDGYNYHTSPACP